MRTIYCIHCLTCLTVELSNYSIVSINIFSQRNGGLQGPKFPDLGSATLYFRYSHPHSARAKVNVIIP